MSDSFEDKLTAARQAYSYLHGFQRALGDTLAHLVQHLSPDKGLTFAKKSATPFRDHISMRQNPNSHDRRTWDWFPTYSYCVFYEWHSQPGTRILEVAFTCDTRWDSATDVAPPPDSAEDGGSRVDLFLWKHDEPERDWYTAWKNSAYPDEVDVWSQAEDGFEVLRVTVPLECLATHEAVEGFAAGARGKLLG